MSFSSRNYFRLRRYFYAFSAVGTVIGGMAVARAHLAGDLYAGEEQLYGKTVVVTGGDAGLGKATATELARRGASVVLACRDMRKCMEAKYEIIDATWNRRVECIRCDLASLDSIRQFVDEFRKGQLDFE